MDPSFIPHIVIDGKGHLVGRLAAVVAKQLLEGQRVTVVRCEELRQSGSLFRNKLKYLDFLRKKSNTNPREHSHIHYRSPSMMFRRVVRGMLRHKTHRGAEAWKRLTVMDGCAGPAGSKKKMYVPEALKHLRIGKDRRTCRLGDLASQVGWKADAIVKRLEEKRKEKGAAGFEKRRAAAKEFKLKQQQAIQNAPQHIKDALALVGRA